MDTIATLDLAVNILMVLDSSTELVTIPIQYQEDTLLDSKYETIFEAIQTLRHGIKSITVYLDKQYSSSAPRSPIGALIMQQLASSCIHHTKQLFEDSSNMLDESNGEKESGSWKGKTAYLSSMCRTGLSKEEIENLYSIVTIQVRYNLKYVTYIFGFSNYEALTLY